MKSAKILCSICNPKIPILRSLNKGRTIKKVMGGGGWGKNQKKIHARENAKKKKFMQRRG